MVYFQPSINNTFSTLSTTNTRPVSIIYNGSGLHTITGPVPMVDISQSVNRNGAGLIEGNTIRIDLTGKIVRTGIDGDVLPGGSGIGPVVKAIQELTTFLRKNDNGVLEIKCDVTNTIFAATGVKLIDLSFNKSDDNWLFTADYNASFEYYEPSGVSDGYYVRSTNDTWSIEPIEDTTYTNISLSTQSKGETHNPLLKPQAPSANNPIPGNFNGAGTIGSNALSVYNIPQYRISHRVSAVGIAVGSGVNTPHSSYLEAKKWVENRLSTAFYQNPSISGLAHFSNKTIPSFPLTGGSLNMSLYNHLRSTNFSITEGSYEINDTWLAMPTGISYIEDYSIESSTDERQIKTVRVQGQIKGLYQSSFNQQAGSSDYTMPNNSGLIRLDEYDQTIGGGNNNITRTILDNTSQNSSFQTISANKYNNAMSGWLYDIKPYLYRRASIAINSIDRDRSYFNRANRSVSANNPIFSYENLLNPNPTSTTEGHDPRKGTISYSMEYNNKLNLISGVISENITISDTGPTDVFSESFVIGRRLGPILQSLNTKTSSRKDVSIDIVVPVPSSIKGLLITNAECPVYTGGSIYKDIDNLIEGLRPFGARTSLFGNLARQQTQGQVFVSQDSQNWNPSDGRYSRSISWIYQQCNITTNYLDH
jgi:hypothetical protein